MSKKPEAVRARDLFAEIHREIPELATAERELGSRLILARNVLRLRVQRSMTQTALARAAGITQPRIAEIENARANPQLDSLERLAVALSVPMESLFKVKHAERSKGTSVRASLPLATRGSTVEGWANMEGVDEVVRTSRHFTGRNPLVGRRDCGAVVMSNDPKLLVFSDG